MNVVFANTRHFFGGGDSAYTINLCGLLRRYEHRVAAFAMRDERNLADPNADLFVDHIDFRALNGAVGIKSMAKVISRVIYSPENRRRFGLLVDRCKPDIIHLQGIHGHISPSIILEAKSRNLPVVWTLHDYKLICPNTHYFVDGTGEICEACGNLHYYRALVKCCKKNSLLASTMASIEAYSHRLMKIRDRVDCFLTPSDFLRKKLIENGGFPSHKVFHVPLFVPQQTFSCIPEDGDYLLFMARLERIKGIHVLAEACRRVPAVKVLLAGAVEKSFAERLGTLLPDNARYVGLKHGEELKKLRSAARAIVLPSICYENQPFTILEAFASGKPVVASDLGGMTELIRHGERGLLVPPGDAEALAEAMQWMTGNPQEARRMGEAARMFAIAEHGEEVHLRRLLEVYSHALGRNGTAPPLCC